jgi:hypothetical protein
VLIRSGSRSTVSQSACCQQQNWRVLGCLIIAGTPSSSHDACMLFKQAAMRSLQS